MSRQLSESLDTINYLTKQVKLAKDERDAFERGLNESKQNASLIRKQLEDSIDRENDLKNNSNLKNENIGLRATNSVLKYKLEKLELTLTQNNSEHGLLKKTNDELHDKIELLEGILKNEERIKILMADAIDCYLNAGNKDQRKDASIKAKDAYREYNGEHYVNIKDR